MLDEIANIAAEAGRIAAARCGTAYRRWDKSPGNPVCDKATNPALVPFDPALAPPTDTAPRFAANGTPQ